MCVCVCAPASNVHHHHQQPASQPAATRQSSSEWPIGSQKAVNATRIQKYKSPRDRSPSPKTKQACGRSAYVATSRPRTRRKRRVQRTQCQWRTLILGSVIRARISIETVVGPRHKHTQRPSAHRQTIHTYTQTLLGSTANSDTDKPTSEQCPAGPVINGKQFW